jgi:hypothetical protein
MRTRALPSSSFFGGFMLALAMMGVTLGIRGALRRRTLRAKPHGGIPHIDGVHPPAPAELQARPQQEGNATYEPLASEAVDVPAISQRW